MSVPPSQPPLSPGEARSFGNGRYVVQRRLGAGNFATVYLAHDERLDVPVALKLLSDRWSWDAEVRGRFVQEARLLRSINDPRVVQIRDIAETDDGRPYLVMDFATEGTLEQRMFELVQRQVRPDAGQLRVAARALAEALGVLHDRRIAHRDIKPSNLLITRDGGPAAASAGGAPGDVLRPGERLMLADLGLAKDLAMNSGVTVGAGTAGYMSPEQMVPGGRIDERTDIFAASALLAQIATGETPDPARRVSGGTLEHGRPLGPLPPALAPVLLRGLDVDPDRRPQTIQQWMAEVDGALAPALVAPAPRPPVPPPPSAPVAAPPPSGPVSGPVSNPGWQPDAVSNPGWQQGPVSHPGWQAGPVSGSTPVPARRPSPKVIVAAAAAVVVLVVVLVLAFSGGGSSTDQPFTVDLTGPTEVKVGEQTRWDVTAPATAVSGTWSLTGPVTIGEGRDQWTPGSWFEGTWNVETTATLTITVRDAQGNTASDSVTFTVVP